MPADNDGEGREAAERIERENPKWIVVFGVYTKQFVCFPRFHAPPGTVVVALYPPALHAQMREVERLLRLPKNLRTSRIGRMMIVRKTLLKGEPEKVREQAEAVADALAPPHEIAGGERLRALAAELARRGELEINLVSYEDGAQELEVVHSADPCRTPVIIARNNSGDQCQITFEQWTTIGDETGLRRAANTVAAILTHGTCAHRHYKRPVNDARNVVTRMRAPDTWSGRGTTP